MKPHRASFLGALAGGLLGATWGLVSCLYGVHELVESACLAAVVFLTLAPLLDRIALSYVGDTGPRILWSSVAWLAPGVGAMVIKCNAHDLRCWYDGLALAITFAIYGGPTAIFIVEARRRGFRSVTLRTIAPWLALAASTGCIIAAFRSSNVSPVAPVAALVADAIGLYGLFRRGEALARICGLEREWLPATMSAEGMVTVGDWPPMHAPAGTKLVEGRVLVQLSAEKAASFRATGAPTILRLVQGMDVDVAGRRAILDEGAKAYATAAALLSAAALLAAIYTS